MFPWKNNLNKVQSLDIKLLAVISIVEALKKCLTDLKTDKDNYSKWYNKVSNICREQKIETSNVEQRKVSNRVNSINKQNCIADKSNQNKICTIWF